MKKTTIHTAFFGFCTKVVRSYSLLAAALLLTSVFLLSGGAYAEWHKTSFNAMGTVVELELWSPDEDQAQGAFAAAKVEIERLEQLLSPYIESSEVSAINRAGVGEPVVISAETYAIIQRSLFYSERSGGAFDVSFAAVGSQYDYRAGTQPDPVTLKKLASSIDYSKIDLQAETGDLTVSLGADKMAIDLGGIAKGFTVDRVAQLLRDRRIESAALGIGGDSRFIGDRGPAMHAKGRIPWVVGIKHPRSQQSDEEFAFRMPVNDIAFSTSGDYERYFINSDGERIHHILDPSSGKSVASVVSVSVIGPVSMDCDALSTTVFVLGVEQGLALIETIEDYDAVIIDGQGKMHYSSGLMP